eukprot:5989669-Prymnesium_polylepis.1
MRHAIGARRAHRHQDSLQSPRWADNQSHSHAPRPNTYHGVRINGMQRSHRYGFKGTRYQAITALTRPRRVPCSHARPRNTRLRSQQTPLPPTLMGSVAPIGFQ